MAHILLAPDSFKGTMTALEVCEIWEQAVKARKDFADNLANIAHQMKTPITSALLLVMVDPIDALIFLIFLVCLQQIEGNVIYPRVVGTSLGLPGIWVLTAVTVGGGLFGLAGVLLSVPVASILYALLRRDVRKRLARQDRKAG